MPQLRELIESHSENAAIAWFLVAAVAVGGIASLAAGDLLWAVYSAAIVAVAIVPPVLTRDVTVVVTWQALLLAAVPVLGRWLGLFGESVTYLSVAALALLVVVEINAFSTAQMPPWFAVLFVVLTTLTVAGLWGILQYASDVALGTSFLVDQEDLMWDLVAATVVGVGAGILFEVLFREYETIETIADGVMD